MDLGALARADLDGVVNISDADMIAAFQTEDVQAVVTWNPLVSTIMETPGANMLFDSSDIPGEIIDMMVVNTETLEANPDFGRALVGAWYELMAIMSSDTEEGIAARTAMAESSGTDLAGFRAQLCLDPDVLRFRRARWPFVDESEALPQRTMVTVAEFLSETGLSWAKARRGAVRRRRNTSRWRDSRAIPTTCSLRFDTTLQCSNGRDGVAFLSRARGARAMHGIKPHAGRRAMRRSPPRPSCWSSLAYSAGSAARLAENPQDRVLPSPATLVRNGGAACQRAGPPVG